MKKSYPARYTHAQKHTLTQNIHFLKSVYLDSKLLFKQVLLKTMEYCWFIIFNLIF